MILKKLDKRHKGFGDFTYLAEFTTRESKKFFEIRNWCWDQWGPGIELELRHRVPSSSSSWSWTIDDYVLRIYIATDKEYQWFLLKWHD